MSRKYIDAVERELSISNQLFVEESLARGVEIKVLPDGVFTMSDGDKFYTVYDGMIALAYNSELATMTMDMKEVTSRMLRANGFNAPENTVFHKSDLDRAWQWAQLILPVVLKPYDGRMGELVYVNIDSFEEFKSCFEKIAASNDEVLIEKFLVGKEYRFTYVDRDVVGIVNRIPANVVGDGEHNVKELIVLKNEERVKVGNPIHKLLEQDAESDRVLKKHGYTFDSVPEKDDVVYLRDNSNISTGGDAVDVTAEMPVEIKHYIRDAMRSIPGVTAVGVDVLINGDEVNIIEVNTYPMITLHHYPWVGEEINVAAKVIDGMFPKTKRTE